MAEVYAACATAEELLVSMQVLDFFGIKVQSALHIDSAVARAIRKR